MNGKTTVGQEIERKTEEYRQLFNSLKKGDQFNKEQLYNLTMHDLIMERFILSKVIDNIEEFLQYNNKEDAQ